MARQAVLLKVQIQTVWVEVDTETGLAVEHIDPPIILPSASWAGFYDKWAKDWAAMQERVAAADVDREKALMNGAPSV